jgi:hypothetical protein
MGWPYFRIGAPAGIGNRLTLCPAGIGSTTVSWQSQRLI